MNTKRIIAAILSVVMLVCAIPVFAAEAAITITADVSEVKANDIVTFTVAMNGCNYIEGGVRNHTIKVQIPAGLEYVEGSAVVCEDYAKTGITGNGVKYIAADRVVSTTAMGTQTPYTGEGTVEIIKFQCKVTGEATTMEVKVAENSSLTNAAFEDVKLGGAAAIVSIHVCTLTEVPAKAATCTEAGNEAYKKCECGKLYDMEGNPIDEIPVIPALGHGEADADGKCPVCGEKIGDSVEEILAKIAAEVEEALADLKATEDGENTPEALQAKIDKIVAEIVAKYQDVTYVVVVDADSFTAAADGKNGAASYAVTLTLGGVDATVYGDVTITANAVKSNKVFIPRLFTVTVECDEGATVNTSKTFKIAFGAARTIKITAEEGYEVVDVLLNGKSVGAVEKLTIKPAVRNYSVKVICAAVDAE